MARNSNLNDFVPLTSQSSQYWTAAKAALCSAAAALALVVVLQSWGNQSTPSLLVEVSGTRSTSASLQHQQAHAQQRQSFVLHSAKSSNVPSQQSVSELPPSIAATSPTTVLSFSMVIGGIFGAVAAFVSSKRNASVPANDEEAAERAPWAAGLALAAALAIPQTMAPVDMMPSALAGLPSSDPVSNPEALLRYSLPIENKEIRQIQKELESINRQLRIPGSKPIGPISKIVGNTQAILKNERAKNNIIASFAPGKKEQGLAALTGLIASLDAFQDGLKEADKQAIPLYQEDALRKVAAIEETMVNGFPFEVPAKYASLPQLRGRATVEFKIKFIDNLDYQDATFTVVLDGYNAPISAGNFMDLVNRGFYDGMTIQRADGFVVQTGDPEGPADGFVNPNTGEVRRIPFEVKVSGDTDPYYEATLEDLGIYNAPVTLPFNAYGTLAMARGEFLPNSASSQIFWLLKDSELTPVGNNVLDGRYAAFGYITKNQNMLKEVKVGDQIDYMKVIDGQENLVPANLDAPPVQFDN